MFVSPSDIGLLLWDDETSYVSARNWASITHKLTRHRTASGEIAYRFEDVERAVLSLLPATFPYLPGDPTLRCEDAMAVMPINAMHSSKRTYACMFTTVDYSHMSDHIAGRVGRPDTIFERFGYTEDDGSRIELRSHALRHYLNMLAQTGGLSSAEIALFSGRKDQKQNRAYDHMTSEEVQMPITQALMNGFTSDLVPVQGGKNLIEHPEFRGLGIPAAHTTEFGWCQHDFASEPCQMYADCINCEEQVCIKGDSHKEGSLQSLKEETEFLLEKARAALDEEEYGADIWVAHQTKTLERVNQLLSILRNPDVPVGARIRLDVTNGPVITKGGSNLVKFVRRNRRKDLT